MKWLRFWGPRKPPEVFWAWFADNAEALTTVTGPRDPLLRELERRLASVHPDLAFELADREFTVSADGILALFPEVERVVASAPPLPGWRIVAFRQPDERVQTIRVDDLSVGKDSVRFLHRFEGSRVDLLFLVDGLTRRNERAARAAVILLVDSTVGEYAAAKRIRSLELTRGEDHPHQGLPWHDLARVLSEVAGE